MKIHKTLSNAAYFVRWFLTIAMKGSLAALALYLIIMGVVGFGWLIEKAVCEKNLPRHQFCIWAPEANQ